MLHIIYLYNVVANRSAIICMESHNYKKEKIQHTGIEERERKNSKQESH